MGTGASIGAILEEESRRPLDASDVDSPHGMAAKNEVMRLRLLLATHYSNMDDVMSEYDKHADYQQQQHACFQESGQQTEECTILEQVYGGVAAEAVDGSDAAITEQAAGGKLAPGIQEYLIACFTAADIDNSGVLSSEEFTRLLREQVDLGLSPEDIQLLHAQTRWMDAKGDVTWQQFVQLAPQLLANLVDTVSTTPSATDWCSCMTTEGTPYYYNKRTQGSVWEKPEELNTNDAVLKSHGDGDPAQALVNEVDQLVNAETDPIDIQ